MNDHALGVPRADYYRERAADLRARAVTVQTTGAREEMYSLAADYELLADYIASMAGEHVDEDARAKFDELRLFMRLRRVKRGQGSLHIMPPKAGAGAVKRSDTAHT